MVRSENFAVGIIFSNHIAEITHVSEDGKWVDGIFTIHVLFCAKIRHIRVELYIMNLPVSESYTNPVFNSNSQCPRFTWLSKNLFSNKTSSPNEHLIDLDIKIQRDVQWYVIAQAHRWLLYNGQ